MPPILRNLPLAALAVGFGVFCAGGRAKPVRRPPEDLRALLEPIRARHNLPALAGAIVTEEGAVASAAVGVRKFGSEVPVTVDDQFHLGSDTKSMTATLIGMLVEEGKFRWDTTLAEALPDLAKTMQPAYRSVTLEQMLAHRAGFSGESWPKRKTFLDMHRLPGAPREQRRIYVETILREEPVAAPGSKYIYSNRSYAVAGAIAERIANVPWEALITRRLFKPLGMTTTGFGAMGTPGKIDEPDRKSTRLNS